MKIYVLTESYPYEGEDVLGVYSSQALAEAAWRLGRKGYSCTESRIYAVDLDGPTETFRDPLPDLSPVDF